MCVTRSRPSTSALTGPPCILLSLSVRKRFRQPARLRLMLHIVEFPSARLTCACFCLSVSVAFLGDIALDEEDLRSFKVDRIIDLAQRTVHIVNHTDTGNNNRERPLQTLHLGGETSSLERRFFFWACHAR